MNTKYVIRIIKNGKPKVPEVPPPIEATPGPNRWSTTVQSWVNDVQKHRRDESLQAFDSLFK